MGSPRQSKSKMPRRHSGGNLAAQAAERRASRASREKAAPQRSGSFGRLAAALGASRHERKQKKMQEKLMQEFLSMED